MGNPMRSPLFKLAPLALTTLAGLAATTGFAAEMLRPEERVQIAKEALIYGYPLVANYTVFYSYFIDQKGTEFKTPVNTLYNTARVYTPADTTIVTPNSDTPYSFVGLDLRAEPFVICNPDIEKSRYFSVQLVDMYTFNYAYIGSRTTGNAAACNMIAGPNWTGEKPEGISNVFKSETEFGIALIRTQLFNPADLSNVKKIQAGYRGVTLSKFLGKPAPPPAPAIKWPAVTKQLAAKNPFEYLNFVLSQAPATGAAAVEVPMRERFAKIGVEAGKPFSMSKVRLVHDVELLEGMKQGMAAIKGAVSELGKDENGWRVATDGFGDRQSYAGNYLLRAAAADAGIYGNNAAEALYPLLATDASGQKVNTAANKYTLTFPAGQLPPVNAFWSVTMYDGKTQLLIRNPIHRYLINSPMLPDLKKNADGSLTLYIQQQSPGKEREANWLPAPNGPAYIVMRLYWPKEEALKASWKPPAVTKVQ